MNLKSLKSRVNNQKGWFPNEKSAKSSVTFRKNKPNVKNVEISVSSFETSKYEILTAWRSENQTQFKANTNPIPERPKMNANIYNTIIYSNKAAFRRKKTNPNKPKQTQFQKGCLLVNRINQKLSQKDFPVFLRNSPLWY